MAGVHVVIYETRDTRITPTSLRAVALKVKQELSSLSRGLTAAAPAAILVVGRDSFIEERWIVVRGQGLLGAETDFRIQK